MDQQLTIQEPYERYSLDVSRMRELYTESERQFIEFNTIIPLLHNRWDIYSPRLVTMLYGIEPQIESMLKILLKVLELKPKSNTFPAYIKELNKEGMLTVQRIHFRESMVVTVPFVVDVNHNTVWHKAYNDSKHDLPHGMNSVNYGHVINAIAALAILHEIAHAIAYRGSYRKEALKKECWHSLHPMFTGVGNFRHTFALKHSNLFLYRLQFAPTAVG